MLPELWVGSSPLVRDEDRPAAEAACVEVVDGRLEVAEGEPSLAVVWVEVVIVGEFVRMGFGQPKGHLGLPENRGSRTRRGRTAGNSWSTYSSSKRSRISRSLPW